jgi:hypothetical protein
MKFQSVSCEGKKAYLKICEYFDKHKISYKKNEDSLAVECLAIGEDLPMPATAIVEDGLKILILYSKLPFIVPTQMHFLVAKAISIINNSLIDGCFDFNIKNGEIHYRMTNSFRESDITDKIFSYMINTSFETIDKYNNRLLDFINGKISIEVFYE